MKPEPRYIGEDLKGNERYTTAEWTWRNALKLKIHDLSELKK